MSKDKQDQDPRAAQPGRARLADDIDPRETPAYVRAAEVADAVLAAARQPADATVRAALRDRTMLVEFIKAKQARGLLTSAEAATVFEAGNVRDSENEVDSADAGSGRLLLLNLLMKRALATLRPDMASEIDALWQSRSRE